MKTIFLVCLLLAQAVVIPLKRDMTSGAENYNNVSFLKTKFTVFFIRLTEHTKVNGSVLHAEKRRRMFEKSI